MLEHINSWSQRAACRNMPFADEVFFPPTGKGHTGSQEEGKKFCTRCPVISECRIYAIAHDVHGIWGGTTLADRKSISQSIRALVKLMYQEEGQLESSKYHQNDPRPLKRVQEQLEESSFPIETLVDELGPKLTL